VVSGRAAVAFSTFQGRRQSLFVARLGQPERLVAGGETPLGFTRARPLKRADFVSSALAADARSSAVAFTASRGNSGDGSHGNELVYLLRPGARAARVVYRERLRFAVCERMASLSWRGPWLYSSSEGRVALIDPRQPAHTVDLSETVARLPGMGRGDGRFDVAWA
jgi:hypothetical protein